jgi:hypothetical protein
MIDLDAIGHDIGVAYAARLARQRARSRALRAGAVVASLAALCTAVAVASDIGPDFQLDPSKWTILGGGSTDGGRGAYVHAKRVPDGSHSTFMVEHDRGLTRYDAFLLHERTKAAANATSPVPVRVEPGSLCTAEELTRAEVVALQALGAFAPGTSANGTKQAVDSAVRDAFAGAPCRGLEYGGEQARLVYAGAEPRALLMPGAR